MGFVKRVCQICGHDTMTIVGCGRVDSDGVTPCGKADDTQLPLRTAIHDHCQHETCGEPDQHGFCTQVGCMAVSQPLGLVNPDLATGRVPDSPSSR